LVADFESQISGVLQEGKRPTSTQLFVFFQLCNNGAATGWVEQNLNLLPIDSRNVAPPSEFEPAPTAVDTPTAGMPSERAPVLAADDPWSQKISIS